MAFPNTQASLLYPVNYIWHYFMTNSEKVILYFLLHYYFFIHADIFILRPCAHGAYQYVRPCEVMFICMVQHRCSAHPHAGSPINVIWDAEAIWTQLLLPIWHLFECGYVALNPHCVRSGMNTYMHPHPHGCKIENSTVSIQPLRPNWH